jgi:hypothetical protein
MSVSIFKATCIPTITCQELQLQVKPCCANCLRDNFEFFDCIRNIDFFIGDHTSIGRIYSFTKKTESICKKFEYKVKLKELIPHVPCTPIHIVLKMILPRGSCRTNVQFANLNPGIDFTVRKFCQSFQFTVANQ